MSYRCSKRYQFGEDSFKPHNIHWWCFLFPSHYKHIQVTNEKGSIVQTPISFRQFLRDDKEGDE